MRCECIITRAVAFYPQLQIALCEFEIGFDLPYADILEMPIFDFLKYWIYRTL